MRKIYVLDENNELKEIDAGITQYSELQDAPIYTTYNGVKLVGSTVNLVNGEMEIVESEGHKWGDEDTEEALSELMLFCNNAPSGRYDILSDRFGMEILIIDKTSENDEMKNRYRRITVDQDLIYDKNARKWISISDSSARELVFSISNQTSLPSTVVVGNRVVLECYYYSTVANGTITIKKGENLIAAANLEIGKTTPINLTNSIVDGVNEYSIQVSNNNGKFQYSTFYITGIKLNYNPNFSVLQTRSNDVPFAFTYSGTGSKYINFEVTNGRGEVATYDPDTSFKDASTGTVTLPANLFSHGENTIATYMYMKEGEDILTKTDTLFYTFPYVEGDKVTQPIVMTYYDFSTIQEWSTIGIPYRVWLNSGETMRSIKFELRYTQDGVTKTQTQEYDNTVGSYVNNYLTTNTEHIWQLSNVPHGVLDFRIFLNGASEPNYNLEGIEVPESDYNFNTIQDYLFNFAANDITDTKSFDTWTSNKATMKLSGFNWTTDGIKTEDNKSLKFSPSAQVTMDDPYNLFTYVKGVTGIGSGSGQEGLTLEFDFKVDETANNKLPIIKYYDPNNDKGFGITIYPNHAVFNYDAGYEVGAEQLTLDYQKGERKNIAITMEPQNSSSTEYLIKLYVDGIISRVIRYQPTVTLAYNCNKFIFNASNNEFHLYSFRAYSRVLNSIEMTQNYISNFASVDEKVELLLANNIYDSTRELTYTDDESQEVRTMGGEKQVSLKNCIGKIGCLVIVTETGTKLPESKKPPIPCWTYYYEKDENNPQIQWDKDNHRSKATTYYKLENGEMNEQITVEGQGTSSMEYPRKNLKFKYKDKFYIKGHTYGKDKTYTVKIDYMDSSGANNITNAQITQNSIIASEWLNAVGTNGENGRSKTPVADGKRLNLDGFPILLFWANGVNEYGEFVRIWDDGSVTEPEFYAIGNFNYDKKPKDLLGWNKKTFMGFEFRDNTSDICLQKGISGMTGFKDANIGFEWRWTYNSDDIDDYYDGNLGVLMNGGYVDEDINTYSESQYLDLRWAKELKDLPPYNMFYVEKDGQKCQIMEKKTVEGELTYTPVNYSSWLPSNRELDVFTMEYGVRISNTTNEDGEYSLMYQLPYGVSFSDDGKLVNTGSLYESGEGYYKYTRNPEHEMKFEYNDTEPYFTDDANWTAYKPLSELVYMKVAYIEDAEAVNPYVFDEEDKKYHLLAAYPTNNEGYIKWSYDEDNETYGYKNPEELVKYKKVVEYVDLQSTDKVKTWDYMNEVFKYWYYAVDTLCHCDDSNYLNLIDNTKTYSDELGNNGYGLFIYDALLQYYCISLITGLCDNFAKNMFMHSYDGGQSWSPAWYDMDTAYGLNNTGAYVFNYDVDFKDPGVFNGSGATLWDKLYRLRMADIKEKFRILRNGHISYDSIMNVVYGENIKYKTEAMYNASAYFRYIIPYLENMSGTQLPAAQGDRLSLLKYWHKNRETCLDSIYGSDKYTSDKITMRMYSPKSFNFELTPDTNMVVGLAFNVSDSSMPQHDSGKIEANTTWSYNVGGTFPLNDLNTYVYGASHLLDIGDISYTLPKNINLSTATKLKRLVLGTDDPDLLTRQEEIMPSQGMIITMPNGVCKNMTEIDLHNLKYVTFGDTTNTALSLVKVAGSVVTNLMPSLKRLNIKGSSVNNIIIGDYTPIEYIGYSDNITTINLQNLPQLTTIDFGKIDKVSTLNITNCANLEQLNVVKLFVNKAIVLTADNLRCDKDNALTMDFMNWLIDINANLAGSIYVESIADESLNVYREKWPNLEVNLKQIYAKDVIFGITGEGGLDG